MANQSILSYETCVHAIAGSTGSIFAMSVFYPLDTIKFRKQLEDSEQDDSSTFEALWKLLKSEGFTALYTGMSPVLTSLGTSNFIYFYTFHGLKHALKTSPQKDLVLGIAAGIVNVLLTTPLWVVNSRLKVKKKQVPYSGLLEGVAYTARTEGIDGLWSGIVPSLMLVINPALQFTIYEYLKRRVSTKSSVTVFLMGAVAKAVATVATYPLQLAQARQRYGKEGKMSMPALLLAILKRGGPKAVFHGLEAKLYQTVLTAALMFVAYEKIFNYVLMIMMRKPYLKLYHFVNYIDYTKKLQPPKLPDISSFYSPF